MSKFHQMYTTSLKRKKILTCGKLQDNLKSIISQIYGSEPSSNNVTIKMIRLLTQIPVNLNFVNVENG